MYMYVYNSTHQLVRHINICMYMYMYRYIYMYMYMYMYYSYLNMPNNLPCGTYIYNVYCS